MPETRDHALDFGALLPGIGVFGGVRRFLEIGNELVLTQGNWVVDPNRPDDRRQVQLPGTVPFAMTSAGGAVWYADAFWPYLIKTDFSGEVLDWAEQPFERVRMGGGAVLIGLQGLAWDGKNLWALDNVNKRICVIEKRAF